MPPKTQILSIIIVVDGRDDGNFVAIKNISETAKNLDLYYEIVVVVNRYFGKFDLENLKKLSSEIENLQIFFLKQTIDYKAAVMVGLENSIGDWVLTIDAYQDCLESIKPIIETAFEKNADVVVALSSIKSKDGIFTRILSSAFNFVFKIIHKYRLSDESSSFKLFARSIVNYILQHDSPLIAAETIAEKSNIKKATIFQNTKKNLGISLRERMHNRWMVLIGINNMPLRLMNVFSGFGALMALIYSLYVVIVNLVKNNVVEGWTTMSLMISMMYLTTSMVLWLISEYLVMLTDPFSRKPRYEIVERISSNIQARDTYINIELEKN